MATPTADTYTAPPGTTLVRGGRGSAGAPAWRSAMTANTWAVVPVAASLESLNPATDPLLNPNYPAKPEWMSSMGWSGIMAAWCGACYDHTRDELVLPLQGGHADYAGNEALALDLYKPAPTWRRPRPPSGAVGYLLTTNDGQEASGKYSDGRARAIHSYNKPVYVPTDDAWWIPVLGNTSWSGSGGAFWTVRIDRVTGEHTFFGQASSAIAAAPSGSGACYDASRDAIWYFGQNGSRFGRFRMATKVWEEMPNVGAQGGSTCLTYIPTIDCILMGNNSGWQLYDCAAGTMTPVTTSGTAIANVSVLGSAQPHYVPSLNAICWWNNSTNAAFINQMVVPASNPKTSTWAISQLPVAAGNSVVPAVAGANGTFGRFQYSPRLGGFILTHLPTGPVWFYALT